MSSDWLVALAPLAGLAGDVVVQITLAHASRQLSRSILAGAAGGLAIAVVATALTAGLPTTLDAVGVWATVLVTYLALAFDYWAFVNLNITSLRIRMLREILRSHSGITQRDLLAEYSSEEFLRRRLERLRNGGQVTVRDDHWHLESRTLPVLATILDMVRAVLLPPPKSSRAEQSEVEGPPRSP